MIIDSSAIVAIALNEPGWEGLDAAIDAAVAPKMSAATYVETGIVIDCRRRATASRRLDQLLAAWNVDIVDVTAEQAVVSRGA